MLERRLKTWKVIFQTQGVSLPHYALQWFWHVLSSHSGKLPRACAVLPPLDAEKAFEGLGGDISSVTAFFACLAGPGTCKALSVSNASSLCRFASHFDAERAFEGLCNDILSIKAFVACIAVMAPAKFSRCQIISNSCVLISRMKLELPLKICGASLDFKASTASFARTWHLFSSLKVTCLEVAVDEEPTLCKPSH